MIDFDFVIEKLSSKLNDEKRFTHSLLVAQKTQELIRRFSLPVDLREAYLAGLVHDYAKETRLSEYQTIVNKYNLDYKALNEPFALLHAFLGIYLIKEEVGIDSPDILEAIYYHPTGYKKMTPLSEVLFLADFIEDSRDYEICITTRNIALVNYKKAIAVKLQFLMNSQKEPHPYTMEAFREYQKYLKE